MTNKNEIINIEIKYNAPVSRVWKALTEKDEMKKWYFDIDPFKAEIGFEFHFSGGPDETKQYLHLCKITELIKEKKIAYSWRYDGYEGNSLVSFELMPEGQNTLLKLTHSGIGTFPSSNPDFAIENFRGGWNHITGISLKEYLM